MDSVPEDQALVCLIVDLFMAWPCMCGSRGDKGSGPPPLKNKKNVGFLCKTCLDSLKHHKANKPLFKVGPTSARQRNAI